MNDLEDDDALWVKVNHHTGVAQEHLRAAEAFLLLIKEAKCRQEAEKLFDFVV